MPKTRSASAAWRSVLADGEFRGLWLSQALSLAGDHLARVAVAVLVFEQTDSAPLTAAAYALSLLPWLIGGPLLGGVGDRYPRRAVMVVCDLTSGLLVVAMIVPGLNLVILNALVFLLVLISAPFTSARAALIRDVFPDDRYASAVALGNVTGQAAQVIGFGVGGAVVAAVGPAGALGIDAATFAVSAVIIRAAIAARPPPHRRPTENRGGPGAGIRLLTRDRTLRLLTAYAWLAAFHVAPNGVVVPYAARHSGGPVTIGMLLAVSALGTVTGMVALTQWTDQDRRIALMPWLAVLAAAPFLLCALDPGVIATAVLWFVASVGSAYQLGANVAFVAAVPNALRAQAFGIVSAGLVAGQGMAILLAGALAGMIPPNLVVALFGVGGTLAGLVLGSSWRRRLKPAAIPG